MVKVHFSIESATPLESNSDKSTAIRLTRVGLITSGVFGLVLSAVFLFPTFGEYVALTALNYQRGILAPLIAATLAPLISLAICRHLIVDSTAIAQRLFPDDDLLPSQMESAMYRVAFTTIGVWIIATTFPTFIHAIGDPFIANAAFNQAWPDGLYERLKVENLTSIITFVLQCTLAIYLIMGAPHWIRWQVSR